MIGEMKKFPEANIPEYMLSSDYFNQFLQKISGKLSTTNFQPASLWSHSKISEGINFTRRIYNAVNCKFLGGQSPPLSRTPMSKMFFKLMIKMSFMCQSMVDKLIKMLI